MTDKEWYRFLKEIEHEWEVDKIYEKLRHYQQVTRMMKFLKVGDYNEGGSNDQSQ